MRWWRHILPVFLVILLMMFARQIYPYTTPLNLVHIDGFEVEKVASGLGGPTCLEWASADELLICDRDGDRIMVMNISDDFEWSSNGLLWRAALSVFIFSTVDKEVE